MKKNIRDRLFSIKKYSSYVLIGMMIVVIIILFFLLFKQKKSYGTEIENKYNMVFYQLVDNMQDIEAYLAKSMISNSPKSSVETLSYVWREANMAETYLSMLPISSTEIEKTAKFLNQVSDYSYSLSKKTLNGEALSQEDLNNLEKLHDYSNQLKDSLNKLAMDIDSGKISWIDFTSQKSLLKNDVDNISNKNITPIEENFHEYAGLIYDGAFSEHMTNPERKGITGNEIDEEHARMIVIKSIGEERVEEIIFNGLAENGNIEAYLYTIKDYDQNTIWISVTKKGGHILFINSNRVVNNEIISEDEATQNAEDFLDKNGFNNMKKTYFSKNGGVETINFAYEEKHGSDNIIVYSDLIKVKVALDDGEILGMESTGYLNSHVERNIPDIKITKEEALSLINKSIDVEGIRLAIIPTEFNTEIMCWEIKGRVGERDFLTYVNIENGNVEDILLILNSSDGILTI